MRNIFILGIITVCISLLMPLTSSQSISYTQSFGTFKQNIGIDLVQICSNSTSICDSCNITAITSPNSTLLINDVAMTKRVGDFFYSLSSTKTSELGTYLVNGYCRAGSDVSVWSSDFLITPSGNPKPNTGEGLSLLGLFGIMILVSGFFLIMAWMSNDQIIKSMFIGLSGFIMAVIVFFGMTTTTQILASYSVFVSNYYTFFFFMVLVIFMAVFSTVIIVFVKSLHSMKLKTGQLDPDNFKFDGGGKTYGY